MLGLHRPFLIAAVVASSASAMPQKIMLELRPRVGDTLRMALQQTTELSGAKVGAAKAPVTTTLKMFSRAIVESVAPIASLILAITDSVDVTSTSAEARALSAETERDLEGRQMRLRLWPDGTVTLNDGAASVPREVTDLLSVMPASFPSKPIKVGDTWTRDMPVPSGESLGIPSGSVVHTEFRLDSTSVDAELAFVSMQGTLKPATKAATEKVAGAVKGSLVVNRKIGWLSESHFLLVLKSVATHVPDGSDFSVIVTQTMHVLRPAKRR